MSMQSMTRISLDMQRPNFATVYAVQDDQLSRWVSAELIDGGTAWEPPAGALVTIRYRKPDGTGGLYDALEDGSTAYSVDGNTVTFGLAAQCLTVPGTVSVELNFWTQDVERLSTFRLRLEVQASVLSDAEMESSDYYNILAQQIAAVLEAAASLTGMTASATSLPAGSDPTADVTGGSGGVPYHLILGIPEGPEGPAGPANVPTTTVTYQAGSSPTTPPSGTWQATPPSVAPGEYLWTRVYTTFSQGGAPSTVYSVARQGVDGSGSAGTQLPLMDGTAEVGTSTSFAPEDHRHPTDTSRAAAADVGTLNGKIVTLGGGKGIFIGDSYSSTATGYTRALPEMLGELLHLDYAFNYAIPGAGYVNGIGTNQHFGGQLASAISDLSDQSDDIAYVFVLGGQNDYAQTVNDIATQADALFAAAKAAFPRAQIVALPLWYNRALSEANALRYTVIYYHAIANGCLTDTLSWAYLITTVTQMMQDGVHPQETSLYYLASCIANAVRGNQAVLPLSTGVITWSSAVGGTLLVTGSTASCATYADGVVTLHVLWAGSASGIASGSNIFRISPVFVPVNGAFLFGKLSNGGHVQITFGSNGYAYNSGAIPANTNLEIDATWSLYTTPMTLF